ncbi:Asp-tRNA(Asn)/Glu-tRNA(Gln) amidotransferase subunit GatA [Patescibacteria group bacterium]|nr:Asp-tRNA(Asn)/Glu-tRNA(Gln) amidotransferase subunit GatA [Patescibacteria group bacterium]
MDSEELTIKDITEGLAAKEFSAVEIAEKFLDVIEKKDKDLNAFITTTPEFALEEARKIDEKIAKNESIGELAGVPVAIKDSILLEGVRCTAGSKILEYYTAPYDATATKKLKEAGAVIVGKTNLDEFSMGSSTENSAFGVTKNPYDNTRVAGGSSGGSAVSVAATECVGSLGGDTGGSIRLPASFCGVVGLKPTYGAVSRYGIIALASSLDQIGPFAKTVEDTEILFNVIRGKDPLDATSVESKISKQIQNSKFKIQNLRIGVPKEYFGKGLDSAVKEIIKATLQKFEKQNAKIVEISLPRVEQAVAVYYVINTSEASANLARYDGMRYGLSVEKHDLLQTYLTSRGTGFGDEVKRRIILGTYVLSTGYYDAYYSKAQRIRTLLAQDFEKAFEKVDVIMGPVSPTLPFKIGEKAADPLALYLADVYTVPVNLAGLPGLSVPIGMVENLPVGLQIIGKPFSEDMLFSAAKMVEQFTQFA